VVVRAGLTVEVQAGLAGAAVASLLSFIEAVGQVQGLEERVMLVNDFEPHLEVV